MRSQTWFNSGRQILTNNTDFFTEVNVLEQITSQQWRDISELAQEFIAACEWVRYRYSNRQGG